MHAGMWPPEARPRPVASAGAGIEMEHLECGGVGRWPASERMASPNVPGIYSIERGLALHTTGRHVLLNLFLTMPARTIH